MITKKCIVCGKEFEAQTNKKKYCSRSCQNKAYFERRKKPKERSQSVSNNFSFTKYDIIDEIKAEFKL